MLQGADFTAEDLTFANTYDEAANGSSRAVAVKVVGDRMVFDKVRLLGDRDTLLTDSTSTSTVSRQYYTDCYVEGDVDFIFGRGTAVFDGCTIHSLDRGSTTARVQVLHRETEMGAHIRTDEPWTDMSGLAWEDARLSEYENTGAEAAGCEPADHLGGTDGWDPIG